MAISSGGCSIMGSFTMGPEKLHYKKDCTFTAKNISLERKKIVLEGMINASNFLSINAEELILDGALIPQPPNYSINVKNVTVLSIHPHSQWIVNLIKDTNGHKSISATKGEVEKNAPPTKQITTPATPADIKPTIIESPFKISGEPNTLDATLSTEHKKVLSELMEATDFLSKKIQFKVEDQTIEIKLFYNPQRKPLYYTELDDKKPRNDELIIACNLQLSNRLKQAFFDAFDNVIIQKVERSPEDKIGCFFLSISSRHGYTSKFNIQPIKSFSSFDETQLTNELTTLFNKNDFAQQLFHFNIDGKNYYYRVLHNPKQRKITGSISLEFFREGLKKFKHTTEETLLYASYPSMPKDFFENLEKLTLKVYHETRVQKTENSYFSLAADKLKNLVGIKKENIWGANNAYVAFSVAKWQEARIPIVKIMDQVTLPSLFFGEYSPTD